MRSAPLPHCASASVFGAALAVADDDRPNVLLLLADDLGYSDLGCYGGEIRTPHLDALVEHGVRFTQTYNSSRCCPSRASLLTGLYPHQAGIGWFVGNPREGLPGHQGRLTQRCVTLAEVLKPAGYSVYACGKWHVNDPGPIARGFEEFYGFTHGYAVNSWEPGMMIRLPEGRPQRTYSRVIAHWPNRIRNAGGFRHHLAHVMDVMATSTNSPSMSAPSRTTNRQERRCSTRSAAISATSWSNAEGGRSAIGSARRTRIANGSKAPGWTSGGSIPTI